MLRGNRTHKRTGVTDAGSGINKIAEGAIACEIGAEDFSYRALGRNSQVRRLRGGDATNHG